MAEFSTLSKQMKHRDRDMVPKVLVQAMFGLMLASVALVGYAQISDQPLSGVLTDSPIAAERSIILSGNRSDGVQVLDDAGTVIAASTDE